MHKRAKLLKEQSLFSLKDFMALTNPITINALYCSTEVLIPCETEILALDGLELLIQTLDQIQEELEIKIKNTYVLPTKVDHRKKINKEVLEYLKNNFNVTDICIRTCSKLNLLGLDKNTIYELDSNCTASKEYQKLGNEVIKWDY